MVTATPLYCALSAFTLVVLALRVIKLRQHHKIALLDGGITDLQRAIRAHGNFAEYTPMFLLLLASAEWLGLALWAVHLFGIVFLLGRISHAYSLLYVEKYENRQLITTVAWRVRGMMITFACLGLLAVATIVLFISALL